MAGDAATYRTPGSARRHQAGALQAALRVQSTTATTAWSGVLIWALAYAAMRAAGALPTLHSNDAARLVGLNMPSLMPASRRVGEQPILPWGCSCWWQPDAPGTVLAGRRLLSIADDPLRS